MAFTKLEHQHLMSSQHLPTVVPQVSIHASTNRKTAIQARPIIQQFVHQGDIKNLYIYHFMIKKALVCEAGLPLLSLVVIITHMQHVQMIRQSNILMPACYI